MFIALAVLAAPIPQDSGSIIVDRNRIDRPRTRTPRRKSQTPKPVPAKIAAPALPAPIRNVHFDGAKAPKRVADAARPFLGKLATAENLTEMAGAMSTAYEDTEVALYTIAIPEQDFSTGDIRVLLTEGRVAKAQLKGGKPGRHGLLRRRMAPLLAEAPLTRRTMERQFSLMRAIPGMTIEPDFTDPDANGALTLTVTPRQKRSKFSAGFSNRGVDLLGDGQWDAKAEFYGAAVDGDQLTLAASAASDFRRYRYGSLTYAAPLTASGLTLTTSAGYIETRPRSIPVKGTAKIAGTALSYPLIRDFHRAVELSLGVDGINSDNAAFGSIIARERTRAVRAGGSYTDQRDKRTVSLGLSASQGLDVLGAEVIAPFAETRFLKANASAYAEQALGKRGAARVTVTGQYSRDRLPAAERFAVGGESVGRAFDTGFITADRGLGAVGELAFSPIKAARWAESEVYVFADRAWVGVLGRGVPGRTDFALASAGAGTRVRYGEKGEIGVEVARVIDKPFAGYDDDWRVSFSWRLSL